MDASRDRQAIGDARASRGVKGGRAVNHHRNGEIFAFPEPDWGERKELPEVVEAILMERQAWARPAGGALRRYLQKIRVARATDSAHLSRLLEAEALLAPAGRLPDDGRELDLLARIAVHQKQYQYARHLWEAAVRKEPQNPTFAACLEALEQAENGRGWVDILLSCLLWMVNLLGLGLLVYSLLP